MNFQDFQGGAAVSKINFLSYEHAMLGTFYKKYTT